MRFGKKGVRKAATWLDASVAGIQFPVAMAIGYFWGKWLDDWLVVTKPWLTVTFALCGVAAGFVNLFRIAAAATRAEEREAREKAEQEAREKAEREGRAQGADDEGGNGGG